MLKKIQRRFILAAMAAFGTVMLVLVAGINIANYCSTTSAQDALAESLLEFGRREAKRPNPAEPPMKEEHVPHMPGRGPGAEFTSRFFVTHCGMDGEIEVISRDYIFSIDEKTAKEYTREILRKGREKGYYGDYRYRVSENGQGNTVLFLNVSDARQYMWTLLFVSTAIGFSSLLVVFLLVLLFSGYAVRPYAKNIERQKQFITDAGHELKTPITSIATSADIAAMEHEGDEWIANIQKQTVRLTRLVGELVALSRLDEEMPFPEKSIFSLSDAAWETAEPFAFRAEAEGKHYSQDIKEGLFLWGDQNSIRQLISILLDNAVKYSGEGGEIRLDIYLKRRRVFIAVWNTCNLPDTSDLDRLFGRFYRVDESRAVHTGGTGIGLSMAQAIAEAHGSRIKVESEDGKSICFQAAFPFVAGRADAER